jgi:hypothetical protein
MVRISRSRMDMEGGRIDQAVIRNYGETLVGGAAGTNTGSAYTVDLSGGNVFNLILNANCTFTFSNPTTSGTACSFVLYLSQGGSKTATWPASVLWQNNTAPTLTATAGRVDIFSFITVDAGTTWLGFVVAQNFNLAGGGGEFWLPYGYFGGGNSPTFSTVDRIDYSNDTATAAVKGPLSLVRAQLAATGTSSFGYFGGGYISGPGTFSTVDRIDYANDTATAAVKGPLSLAHNVLAATGTSSFGYFGGGYNGGSLSVVDRIDYSNDTATAAAKGPLSSARYYLAATGTSSFGYFGGGIAPFSGRSTLDRISYSSDTSTAAVKGPLSLARYLLAATGTSSFGYFGGGGNPFRISTIDRIDYSNDTATAVAKGPLSLARGDLAATGTSSFGYFGGGDSPAFSTVDRIDYTNDTATAAVKGPLSLARYLLAATNHAAGL